MTTHTHSSDLKRRYKVDSSFTCVYPSGYVMREGEKVNESPTTGESTSGVIDSIGGSKWDSDGLPLWKPCEHNRSLSEFGDPAAAGYSSNYIGEFGHVYSSTASASSNPTQVVYSGLGGDWSTWMKWLKSAALPNDQFPSLTQEAIDGFWDSLDLNFNDSVLLYADVLQMIPLAGAVFKINSVLSKISRWATRELRKKPFRTVVKSAITADFVKRFVVDTTIADINSVNNVYTDVLKRLNTYHTRNMSQTMNYKVTKTFDKVLETKSSVGRILYYGIMIKESASHQMTRTQRSQVTLNVLADVRYQEDPNLYAKLIAQRLGLTRPLESVWDLIPFSFVADYFLRTGDFIHELSKEVDSIDSAKAKIGGIKGIWLHSKASNRITDAYSGVYHCVEPTYGMPPVCTGKCGIESSHYSRQPLANLWDSSGFFDGTGIWNPELSSTRKRTIVELFIQRKL